MIDFDILLADVFHVRRDGIVARFVATDGGITRVFPRRYSLHVLSRSQRLWHGDAARGALPECLPVESYCCIFRLSSSGCFSHLLPLGYSPEHRRIRHSRLNRPQLARPVQRSGSNSQIHQTNVADVLRCYSCLFCICGSAWSEYNIPTDECIVCLTIKQEVQPVIAISGCRPHRISAALGVTRILMTQVLAIDSNLNCSHRSNIFALCWMPMWVHILYYVTVLFFPVPGKSGRRTLRRMSPASTRGPWTTTCIFSLLRLSTVRTETCERPLAFCVREHLRCGLAPSRPCFCALDLIPGLLAKITLSGL